MIVKYKTDLAKEGLNAQKAVNFENQKQYQDSKQIKPEFPEEFKAFVLAT